MHAFSTQNTYTHIHTHTTPSFSQQNSHQTNKTKRKKRLTFLLVFFSHPCNLPKAGTSLSPATHLAFTFYFTQAMSSSGPSPSTTNFQSPSLTIVLAVILLIFFILGFLSVYFCRCFMESLFNSWNLQRTPSGNLVGPSDAANHGLDPIFIKSFPTFIYSTIKDFRKDKYGLECAICLVEFEDDSLLRLLTLCYHVFHQECIDLWLESHTTCPVCRRNLDSPPAVEESPLRGILGSSNNNNNDSVIEGAISIEIREDDNDVVQEGREGRSEGDDHNQQQKSSLVVVPDNVMADNKGEKVIQEKIERFSRSHSTGHSIVRTREEDDQEEEVRHTLRVPEHVRLKLIRGHYHYWTGSCTTYGELSRRHKGNCGGFGEVSGCACAAGDINKK